MSFDLHHGDALEVLRGMKSDSYDACVTDPPYGIRFMGAAWDGKDIEAKVSARQRQRQNPKGRAGPRGEHNSLAAEAGKYNRSPSANVAFQLWCQQWASEVFRVLKPGAYLVSFCSTRTYHRMTCGIEDAGFEIRDQLAWVFGSGFPKSHNLTGEWAGWGTALKPAWEPIALARKPFKGTVAANVAKHRTGALNIDGCRVATGDTIPPTKNQNIRGGRYKADNSTRERDREFEQHSAGRWPANLAHDGSPEVVAHFPAEAGAASQVKGTEPSSVTNGIFGKFNARQQGEFYADNGSAARFFYCPKASSADRDAGLDAFPVVVADPYAQHRGRRMPEGSDRIDGAPAHVGRNFHPTVKPTELMRWLCRLVTPKGGRILDPFTGSGSTGRGAILEGFEFVGIEKEAAYLPIARARLAEAAGPLFAQ